MISSPARIAIGVFLAIDLVILLSFLASRVIKNEENPPPYVSSTTSTLPLSPQAASSSNDLALKMGIPTTTIPTLTQKNPFSYQGIEMPYPASWSVEERAPRLWVVFDEGKEIGTIECPIPVRGYVSWLTEENYQQREFRKNTQRFGATFTLAPPFEEEGDIGWLALLTFGKKDLTDPEFIDPTQGCTAAFKVSNPPTAAERTVLQKLYQSVK